MNIYVESNFVLEVALLQEQYESCEKIITLCKTGKAHIIIPAFSLVEPYETIIRNAQSRKKLYNDLSQEIRQLSRSKPYKEQVDTLQEVTALLVSSEQDEKLRLRDTLNRLLAIAEIIPLKSETISSATDYQTTHDLSPQDSIVYASIIDHLRISTAVDKCFLNRNSRDFDDPDIVDTLNAYRCKMLFRFDTGYSYVNSQIGS